MQLYSRLAEEIGQGKYLVGEPLPKVRYLAAAEKVSDHTVREALRMLEESQVIRRHGRGYVAGTTGDTRHPVILSCQPKQDWWNAAFDNRWFAPACSAFMRETTLSLTRVVPVLWQQNAPEHFVQGPERIERSVHELGDRFLGVLISGQNWDYLNHAGVDLPALIRWFVRLRKPVIWLDPIDEFHCHNPKAVERDAYARMGQDPRVRARYTRCHLNEEHGLRIAIDALYALGHRDIGLPLFTEDEDKGAPVRVARLISMAGKYRDMRITVGRVPKPETVDSYTLRGTQRDLRPCAQAMKTFVSGNRFTALIALNDRMARLLYPALRVAGYTAPDDLSFVSFDNEARLLFPWQISSVDFGIGYLGYVAYHLLAGDLRLRRDGLNLCSRCTLNHFGSLGMARK